MSDVAVTVLECDAETQAIVPASYVFGTNPDSLCSESGRERIPAMQGVCDMGLHNAWCQHAVRGASPRARKVAGSGSTSSHLVALEAGTRRALHLLMGERGNALGHTSEDVRRMAADVLRRAHHLARTQRLALNHALLAAGRGRIEGVYAARVVRRALGVISLPGWDAVPYREHREVLDALEKSLRLLGESAPRRGGPVVTWGQPSSRRDGGGP